MFIKYNFKVYELEKYDLKALEPKIKKNLIFLKDKDYNYYRYWYNFYLLRKNKKPIDTSTDEFYYLGVDDMTENKAWGLGRTIFFYLAVFRRFLKYKMGVDVTSTHFPKLMLYYAFNAGFLLTTFKNRPRLLELDYYNIMIIDIRNKKPRIFCLNEDKTIVTLTTGIITKILDIKEKNLKKSSRVLNVIIKTARKRAKEKTNKPCFLVYIKGVKKNISEMANIINNNFDDFSYIVMYNPYVRRNLVKFKKIKSIKRNLLKKHIKYEKISTET